MIFSKILASGAILRHYIMSLQLWAVFFSGCEAYSTFSILEYSVFYFQLPLQSKPLTHMRGGLKYLGKLQISLYYGSYVEFPP